MNPEQLQQAVDLANEMLQVVKPKLEEAYHSTEIAEIIAEFRKEYNEGKDGELPELEELIQDNNPNPHLIAFVLMNNALINYQNSYVIKSQFTTTDLVPQQIKQ